MYTLENIQNQYGKVAGQLVRIATGYGHGNVDQVVSITLQGGGSVRARCLTSCPPPVVTCFQNTQGQWFAASANAASESRDIVTQNVRRSDVETPVRAKYGAAFLTLLFGIYTDLVGSTAGATYFDLPLVPKFYTLYYVESGKRPVFLKALEISQTRLTGSTYEIYGMQVHLVDKITSLVEFFYQESVYSRFGVTDTAVTVFRHIIRFLIKNGRDVTALPGWSSGPIGSGSTLNNPNNRGLSGPYKKYYVNSSFPYTVAWGARDGGPVGVPEAYFGKVLNYYPLNPDSPYEAPPKDFYWRAPRTEVETVLKGKFYIPVIKDPEFTEFLRKPYVVGIGGHKFYTNPTPSHLLSAEHIYPGSFGLTIRKGSQANDVTPSKVDAVNGFLIFFNDGPNVAELDWRSGYFETDVREVEIWSIGQAISVEDYERIGAVRTTHLQGTYTLGPGINYENWKEIFRAKRVGKIKVDLRREILGLTTGTSAGRTRLDIVSKVVKVGIL